MNTKTKKIVITALFAALTCVATVIIKIPSSLNGYLNLGDCIVVIAGWFLSPAYGFLAAGLGSALADLFSGYLVYVPATFFIKGIMALIAFDAYKGLHNKVGNLPSRIISGVLAELLMVLAYFVFDGFLYGFIPSLVNIPANGIQGIVDLIIGVVLTKFLEKSKISFK